MTINGIAPSAAQVSDGLWLLPSQFASIFDLTASQARTSCGAMAAARNRSAGATENVIETPTLPDAAFAGIGPKAEQPIKATPNALSVDLIIVAPSIFYIV